MQQIQERKTSSKDLEVFRLISDFVSSLREYFGTSQKTIVIYNRMLNDLSLREDDLILQHIFAFKKFCVENRDAIVSKSTRLIKTRRICFSDNIYLDILNIIEKATDCQDTIWEYLLSISAYLDPETKAKQVLQQINKDDSNEGQFLNNMVSMLTEQFQEAGNDQQAPMNPMDLVGKMLNPEMMNKMMQTIQSSDIDINALAQSVSGIMTQIGNEAGQMPEFKEFLEQPE